MIGAEFTTMVCAECRSVCGQCPDAGTPRRFIAVTSSSYAEITIAWALPEVPGGAFGVLRDLPKRVYAMAGVNPNRHATRSEALRVAWAFVDYHAKKTPRDMTFGAPGGKVIEGCHIIRNWDVCRGFP